MHGVPLNKELTVWDEELKLVAFREKTILRQFCFLNSKDSTTIQSGI